MNSTGNSGGSSTLVLGGGAGRDSSGGSPNGAAAAPPPPPPPPPPLPSSSMPAGRVPAAITARTNVLETAVPMRRRPLSNDFGSNEAYEPPAAIQNAMMTKDKKPFTYTPGMGGKLDLSQIRSPRMARRVAKNANDEGIEAPPRSATTEPPVPSSIPYAAQPRVAVPVFPSNNSTTPLRSVVGSSSIPATPVLPVAPVLNNNRISSNVLEAKITPPPRTGQMMSTTPAAAWSSQANSSAIPSPPSPPATPTTPPTPPTPPTPTTPPSPQITLAKAPTPWLQNRNKSQQEQLPEWAKRNQSSVPASSPPPERETCTQNLRERIIPLRIEDRPSVFSIDNNDYAGHQRQRPNNQQPQQSSSRHQQRWGNASPSSPVNTPTSATSTTGGGGTYIVPIILEAGVGGDNNNNNATTERHSPRVIIHQRSGGGGGGSPSPQSPNTQYQYQDTEPGPVQSRSFRVLQKITDTDVPIDRVDDGQQTRKLRLTENDKVLMNKVKERVDGEGAYLHQEEDPRYRGAAIPSRAFRYLRNMTDSGDPSIAVATSTASGVTGPGNNKIRQTKNSPPLPPDEFRVIVPASEQQVPEPKKYTGSAIPSRSFRMLQAMTSPESIAKRDNRQVIREIDSKINAQLLGEGRRRRQRRQAPSLLSSSPFANQYVSLPLLHRARTQQAPMPQLLLTSHLPFYQYSVDIARCDYHSPLHHRQSSSSSSSSASSSSASLSSSSSSSRSSPKGAVGKTNDFISPVLHPISRSPIYAMCNLCHRHHYPHNRCRRHCRFSHRSSNKQYRHCEHSNGASTSSFIHISSIGNGPLPPANVDLVENDFTAIASAMRINKNLSPSCLPYSSSFRRSESSSCSFAGSSRYCPPHLSVVVSPIAGIAIDHTVDAITACVSPQLPVSILLCRQMEEKHGYDCRCAPCLERKAPTEPSMIISQGSYGTNSIQRRPDDSSPSGSSGSSNRHYMTERKPPPWYSDDGDTSSRHVDTNSGRYELDEFGNPLECIIRQRESGGGGSADNAAYPEGEAITERRCVSESVGWNTFDVAPAAGTSKLRVKENAIDRSLFITMNIPHQEEEEEEEEEEEGQEAIVNGKQLGAFNRLGHLGDEENKKSNHDGGNAAGDSTSDDSLSDEFLEHVTHRGARDNSETSDDDDSDSYVAYSTGHRDKQISTETIPKVMSDASADDGEQRNDEGHKMRVSCDSVESLKLKLPLVKYDNDENIGNDVCVEFKISIRSSNVSSVESSPGSSMPPSPPSDDGCSESLADDDSIDFWKEITMGRDEDTRTNENSFSRTRNATNFIFDYPSISQPATRDEEEGEEEKDKMGGEKKKDEEREEEEEEEEEEVEEKTASVPLMEKSRIIGATLIPVKIQITEASNDHHGLEREEENGETDDLTSVENLHQETSDDEDSGVTSDTSRLISEVDTDSECGSGGKTIGRRVINNYKRTQTHSRLFKLLNNGENNDRRATSRGIINIRGPPPSSRPSNQCHSNLSSLGVCPDHCSTMKNCENVMMREEKTAHVPSRKHYGGGGGNNDQHVCNGARLPNWHFRRPVSCPRIKSWKNIPGAAAIIGEKDSPNENGTTTRSGNKLATSLAREYGRC